MHDITNKSAWETLSHEKRHELTKLSRQLIKGSIIEDAATRFMAMCISEAVEGQKKKDADRIEALTADLAAAEAKLAQAAEVLEWCRSRMCEGFCEDLRLREVVVGDVLDGMEYTCAGCKARAFLATIQNKGEPE